MSFTQIQNAFASAQRQLAQFGGMPATAAGNVIYNGATYTGVFGNPSTQETMNPGGGNRRITEEQLRLTRAQFEAAPLSQTNLTRTDISPPSTYRISNVDTNDPVFYWLTVKKVG